MGQSIKNQIVTRLLKGGNGGTFTPKDFLDLGGRGSVDVALGNLVRDGIIRRIRRGLYDIPRVSELLGGQLSPNVDETAKALARRFSWKIVPDGAWAANLLGLSTQVPAKIVYLSDGPTKKVAIGRQFIHFKHARPQTFIGGTGKSGLVIQALRNLGVNEIDDRLKLRLKQLLSDSERRQLVNATRRGVEWIHEIAKEISEDSP